MTTFTDLGVVEPITAALAEAGITDAFPIQELCIPQALEGRDLIGQAKTGTGKTLGFGIPLLQRIPTPGTPEHADLSPAEQRVPKALVVVPTRELCVQVASDLDAGRRRARRPGPGRLRRAAPTSRRSRRWPRASTSSSARPVG